MIGVSGNQALVQLVKNEGSFLIENGAAIVSYNPSGTNKSFCHNVTVTRTKQCRIKKAHPTYYEVLTQSIDHCDVELRFSGDLANVITPVNLNIISETGITIRKLKARKGKVKISLPISDNILSVSISAPRDGFKKYHSSEINFQFSGN